MTTTLNLPDDLVHQIEETARAAGVSVDSQATELLSKALADAAREKQLMERIRTERELLAKKAAPLTDDIFAEDRREREMRPRPLMEKLRIAEETRQGSSAEWLTPEYIRAAREEGRE